MGWLERASSHLEGTAEEEEEWLTKASRHLSAGQAAVPAYLSNQLRGAQAIGEIAGADTSAVEEQLRQQEQTLQGYRPEVPDLFKAKDFGEGVQWWKDQATLNSMNQIVPMLGYVTGGILQAIPHPVSKVLGKTITAGTFGTQYNANLGDTLQEHEERAGRPLSTQEKLWAGAVAGGVVALDYLTPAKVSKDVVRSMGGMKNVKTAREQLIKKLNKDRQSLAKSLAKGGKYAAGIGVRETGTEAAQKALQITTSQDPGYLGTTEGLQSVVQEGLAAGPTSAIISTPQAALEGTAANRAIARARREASIFNRQQKEAASDLYEKTGIKTDADVIKIPEQAESWITQGTELVKKNTGFDAPALLKKAGDISAFKSPSILLDARDRVTSGQSYSNWDKIIKSIIPAGTASGELGRTTDFFTLKDKYHGQLYKDINEVLNRIAPRKPGQLTQPKVSKELNDHIRAALDDRSLIGTRPDLIKTNDLNIIVSKVNETGRLLSEKTGSGFIENYLHKPLDATVIREDKEGFIDSLLTSSKKAYLDAKKAGKSTSGFIYQEDGNSRERAEQIATEIIQGRDPFEVASRYIRKTKERKGRGQEAFEKSRSKEWRGLDDKYRQQDIQQVLENYVSKAATRLASADSFGGKNANKLQKRIRDLQKKGDIKKEEIDRIWDIYDAAHNIYKRDVSEGEQQWRSLSKGITTVSAITHLGFATFSSLPELVWTAERAGLGNMLLTLPAAFDYTFKGAKQALSGKRMTPSEGATTLANLGFNLNPQMNERLDQLFATDRNAILSMYFRSPFGAFLTQWTNFNRNWAAQAGMMSMNRRAKGLVNDTIDPMDKRRLLNELRENNLTLNEFKQLADLSKDADGNININMVDDTYLDKTFIREDGTKTRVRDVLHPWVHKIVTDVVIHPVATNKPLWMSDPSLSTIAQLKTFPIVFGNTVVKRLIRKLKPTSCSADFGLALAAIGSIMAAMSVAYIGEGIKDAIRGQDKDLDWVDLGNTAGLFGAGGLVLGSRHGRQDLLSSLAGPGLDNAINKPFMDFLVPFITGEEGVGELGGDLIDWGKSGLISAGGVSGELLFGDEK